MNPDYQVLLSSLAEDFQIILALKATSFALCDPSDLPTALNHAFSVLPNSPTSAIVQFALDQMKVGFYQFVGWAKSSTNSDFAYEVCFHSLVLLSEAILTFLHSALQPISNSALSDQLHATLQAIESVRHPSDTILVSV